MKKYTTILMMIFPICAHAGDRKILWRIGEINNQIMFYLDDGAFFTNIPSSIFFFGITISTLGLMLFPAVWFIKRKTLMMILGLSPLVATIGAFSCTSFFGWIGTHYFNHCSVSVFWSWHSVGAMLGGSVFFLGFLKPLYKNKNIANQRVHSIAGSAAQSDA